MSIHVGTSGWSYNHWDGVLYDPGLPPWRRLNRYTAEFSTVELNASFYRWPNDRAFASWRERLPDGFVMSVKAPRGLTHAKKLYAPEVWVQRLSGAWHELAGRRAVILVQLPPTMARDDARLAYFLAALPGWMSVAVELRHPSWNDDAVFALLEQHGAAYCVMSGANMPCVIRSTSNIVYVRMHGPDHDHLYAGSYSDADLVWWADRAGEWAASGHEVFVYFNNDGGGEAVRNARVLRGILTARGLDAP